MTKSKLIHTRLGELTPGQYANFFAHDWMVTHARIEIFADATAAERLAKVIVEAAYGGGEGDGLVAILKVAKVSRSRTNEEFRPGMR